MKKLAQGVKEGTLHNLITKLLLWLLDKGVLVMDGSQLLKAMNVLMLKILVRSASQICLACEQIFLALWYPMSD